MPYGSVAGGGDAGGGVAGGSLAGVVKSWNSAKGFGFITSDTAGIEGDVLFSFRELPEDAREVVGKFLEGRPVTFEAEEKEDGRIKATSVHLAAVEGQPVTGMIKSYSEKNGYGFVKSSSLSADVRFHRQDIPASAQGANLVGALVAFVPQALPDGKLRVSQLQFQSKRSAQKIAAFTPQTMQLSLPGYGMQTFAPQQQAMPPRLGGKNMTGKVKSFSEKNGYGFIVSPQQPGVDIKFGKIDMSAGGTVVPGSSVSFTVAAGRDGRAQAKNVTVIPSQGVKRGLPGGCGGGHAALKHQRVGGCAGGSSSGAVKSYNAAKGFGFVECAAVIGDVYFQRAALPGPAQQNKDLAGQPVSFELKHTADGKPQAANIQVDS
mmetsp:Transcript_107531/g.303983  ORF Transcript_107531/g.303983 Transcript_107531/m.303983 type:complete len:376 (+) Transcript_107531:65-1192(+)